MKSFFLFRRFHCHYTLPTLFFVLVVVVVVLVFVFAYSVAVITGVALL
jgi:hypothetical protein